MRLIIFLVLPFVTFFTINRPISAVICLLLQITLIGWIPAALWSVYSFSQHVMNKKINKELLAQSV